MIALLVLVVGLPVARRGPALAQLPLQRGLALAAPGAAGAPRPGPAGTRTRTALSVLSEADLAAVAVAVVQARLLRLVAHEVLHLARLRLF